MRTIKKMDGREEYTLRNPDDCPGMACNWLTRIGGRDETAGPKVVPNVNISRWGNIGDEAWLNINYPATKITNEIAVLSGGRLEIVNNGLTHRWYPVGNELEWELEIAKKPASNKFVFDLDFPAGVTFHYQPDAVLRPGDIQPDRVKRSYAVYWNKKNGPYKTGKLGHIYRPWAVDFNDNRVWCEMVVDAQAKTLTITIPQAWLGTAMFPIILDPTYGYTVTPAFTAGIGRNDVASSEPVAAMPERGRASTLHIYCKKAASSPDVDMDFDLYRTSDGVRVDLTSNADVTWTSAVWLSRSVVSGAVMGSGAGYTLAMGTEDIASGEITVYYDVVSGYTGRTWGSGGHVLPDDLDSLGAPSTSGAFALGAYVTYDTDWGVGDINGVGPDNQDSVNGVSVFDVSKINGA